MQKLKTNQKGITLIALIITIIVMLILVGVTINVALNGGLFAKAEKATYQTEASIVKEQLEIAKAVAIADNGGNPLNDYSKITVENLDGLDSNTKDEYKDKILVNTTGDICYNPEAVTDTEERNWLEELGIDPYVETNAGDSYTFTLADAANKGLIPETSAEVMIPLEDFWPENVSEELKNSTITGKFNGSDMLTYNITCSNPNYSNIFDLEDQSGPPNAFALFVINESIMFAVFDELGDPLTMENYTEYSDLTFTISMPE